MNSDFRIAGFPLSAIALLLLTTAVSLLWSHFRLVAGDEFYEIWTDSLSNIRQVINIQRTCPISLDPMTFHAIAHETIRVFGANAFAIRLPSLLSVILMQICLFIFVRRVATERAAVFALGFPVLTCVLDYSIEGRPYALMLGMFGLAMVSWQAAIRSETGRTISLITLAIAIVFALNTHYFAILLLAPLCVAELFRGFQRRRFDIPVATSIGVGAAGIVFVIPFMKAAHEFRSPYGSGLLTPKAIIWDYLWTLANHNTKIIDRGTFSIVVILVCVSLWAYLCRLREKTIAQVKPDEVFLLSLAALPLFGYILAFFTSPVLEPRFVVGLVIGITALTAIGLFSLCRSDHDERVILSVLFVAIASSGIAHIYLERKAADKTRLSMALPPEIKALIMTSPSRLLYIQDIGTFGAAAFYEPDPEVRSRIVLVYSTDQEMKWIHKNVISLTAIHMRSFTNFNIIPYESLTAQPGDHIFVDFGETDKPIGWNWLGMAFASAHAEVKPLGSAFCGSCEVTGEVVSVRFLP